MKSPKRLKAHFDKETIGIFKTILEACGYDAVVTPQGCYGVISRASLRAIKAATRAKKSNKKGNRESR
jgi:hypothetical protein